MMKVLFIETPAPYVVRQHTQISLGLLYLATVVKQKHEVKFIRPDTIKEINCSGIDVVCLSSTTLEYPMTIDVARFIRSNYPNVKIFVGGTHVSALPDDAISNGFFDSVCIGEGENIILEMLTDLSTNELKKIYKAGQLIENLDSIPFPDRSLIEGNHGGSIFIDRETTNENIITSRGCHFNCAFCGSRCTWGRKVRYRSTENIINEIKEIINKYNNNVFRFSDDSLTSDKKRCLKLCSELKKLDIVWRTSIRAESVSDEIATALINAGCIEISVGIESGDQRVLDFLNKRTTTTKMLNGCDIAKKAGLNVRALLMIGTPGERADTPEITRKYLSLLNQDMVCLSTFIPLPGTPIWNYPDKFNCEILTKDFSLYNKNYFIFKNGKALKRKYIPLIHNKFLSIDEQKNNIERMEKYIEKLNYNKGQ